MPVTCFLLEPVERVRQKLRRYSRNNQWDSEQQRMHYSNPCPLTGTYHTAETTIEDTAPRWREDAEGREGMRILMNGTSPDELEALRGDPRWPTRCACGYVFKDDECQLFCEQVYRRVETGEEMTIREAPPGAMWYAPWVAMFYTPQLPGGPLVVKLPDGTDWQVDSQATNCTLPDDFKQKRHHCWVIEGEPPNVSVSKAGATCQAVAGSIATSRWHGFLREGHLVEA